MSLPQLQATSQDVQVWEESNLAQLKAMFKSNLTDNEFRTFIEIGRRLHLNPYTREIWAIKYDPKSAAQIFVGRDGYRKNAQRNPDYDYHVVDAVHANDKFDVNVAAGEVIHKYNVADRGKLLGAYCIVKRRSSSRCHFSYVELSEYSTQKALWNGKPSTMIKKVAEAQTLRMAFQELYSGTYDEAERWRNDPVSAKPVNENIVESKTKVFEGEVIKDEEKKEDMDSKLDDVLLEMSQCTTMDDLRKVFQASTQIFKRGKDDYAVNMIIANKNKKISEIQAQEKTMNEFKLEIEKAESEDKDNDK